MAEQIYKIGDEVKIVKFSRKRKPGFYFNKKDTYSVNDRKVFPSGIFYNISGIDGPDMWARGTQLKPARRRQGIPAAKQVRHAKT